MTKRFGRKQKRKLREEIENQKDIAENRLYIEWKRRVQAEASLQRSLLDFARMKEHFEEKIEALTCGKNATVQRFSLSPEQTSFKVTEIQLAGFRFSVQGEILNVDAMRYAKEFAEQIEKQIYNQLLPLVIADREELKKKGMLPRFEM